MSNEIKIELTLEFQKNLKKLAKKSRSIRSDLESLMTNEQQTIMQISNNLVPIVRELIAQNKA